MSEPQRPVLRYFGGKWRLAPWIISHFPPHRVYVESFGGGASVLMRKPRSKSEVYNDLDGEIVNVFRVLRDPQMAQELEFKLRLTPFSRAEFDDSHTLSLDMVEQARRSIVRSFQGHGADSLTKKHKSGFRAKTFNSNRDASKDWTTYFEEIKKFTNRLLGVVVENNDALKVIETNDGEDTLHFIDPPYVHDTRTSTKNGYRFEMTNDDHRTLCDVLRTVKGMVVLCGYQNEIYERLGWHSVKCEALADGAKKRTEVLWLNSACENAQSQLSFFTETGA